MRGRPRGSITCLSSQLMLQFWKFQRIKNKQHIKCLRSQAGKIGNQKRWREHRIVKHMPIVQRLAKQVAPMFARQIPLEDLEQAGYVGLTIAADRYQPGRGDFERYAWFVVRGAIIDAHKRRAYQEERHESLEGTRERLGFLPADMARDTAPLPDALAEQSEAARTVALLIAELPEADAALMRSVMAGATVTQAARSLGRSPAWGRARLAEARDRVGAGMVLR